MDTKGVWPNDQMWRTGDDNVLPSLQLQLSVLSRFDFWVGMFHDESSIEMWSEFLSGGIKRRQHVQRKISDVGVNAAIPVSLCWILRITYSSLIKLMARTIRCRRIYQYLSTNHCAVYFFLMSLFKACVLKILEIRRFGLRWKHQRQNRFNVLLINKNITYWQVRVKTENY